MKSCDANDFVRLRSIVEEKVNRNLRVTFSNLRKVRSNQTPEQIIEGLQLKSIEDEAYKEYTKMCHELSKSSKIDQEGHWTNISFDYYNNYTVMIENLNGNSTVAKLKVLDELLSFQILDTKHAHWMELSKSLYKCFLNSNNDIFIRTLRIHHRIISFQNTCTDGFLSLLQGTILLLKSQFAADLNRHRLFQILQLILHSVKFIIKSLLHASHKIIDDIVLPFVNVVTIRSITDIMCVIDKGASWLQYFCYGAFIRSSFFSALKVHAPNYITNTVRSFLVYLTNGENFSNTQIDYSINCGYFIMYFLSYPGNCNFFPVQIVLDGVVQDITVNKFLEILIKNVNLERKSDLVQILINLIGNNCNLLNVKLLERALQPVMNIDQSTIRNQLESHQYVFEIVTNLAVSKKFPVLFGTKKLHKPRPRQLTYTNMPQKIVNLVATYLQLTQNKLESQHNEFICVLLDCVQNIYQSHPVAVNYINPTKLIMHLQELQMGFTKNGGKCLNIFVYFYSYYPQIHQLIDCKSVIVDNLFTFTPAIDLKLVVYNFCTTSCDIQAFDVLNQHCNKIMKVYLEEIWYLEEKEEDFQEIIFDLVLFLYGIKLNYKASLACLLNDSEGTLVENDDKTTLLGELIERSLNSCNASNEEYLGFIVMKVLITNVNVMLYLEVNYEIQDYLKKLQETQDSDSNIIDAHRCTVKDIIDSVNNVGCINCESEEFAQAEGVNMPNSESNMNEMMDFLESSEKSTQRDFGWILHARRAFKNSLQSFDPQILPEVLTQIPKSYVYRKKELAWPHPDSVYYQLYPEDFCGISVIIKYGQQKGLLHSTNDNDTLTLLIKQSRAFIGHRPDEFNNFDWFVGIIFLICCGDYEKCKSCLIHFTDTHVTSIVWSTFAKEFDASLQEKFYQQFDIVLEETSSALQALKMLGLAPKMLIQSWLNQCFFNYLSFEEIGKFLIFAVIYPPECLLYYLVAIFERLKENICAITNSPNIENLLNMEDFHHFKLTEEISFIENMAKHYRNVHKL